MMMICVNYLKSIEMEPIPPLAILLCSLLIVAGNFGAQVSFSTIDFLLRSPTVDRLCSPCEQLQAIILERILAAAEPLHGYLIERSEFYRHGTEALMERWIRSFRSIPLFLLSTLSTHWDYHAGPRSRGVYHCASICRAAPFGSSSGALLVLRPAQFDFSLVDAPSSREHNRIRTLAAAMLARASAKIQHPRASRWHSPIAIRQPIPSPGRRVPSNRSQQPPRATS